MRDWRGKKYWLIGASEGLGRALAMQMSRAGAELILSARDAERLADLQSKLPGVATVLPLDVTDGAAFDAAAAQAGPVDGLVYMAGLARWVKPGNWNTADAVAMADINLTGALRAIGAVLPAMVARNSGHIVLTGSLAGYRGLPRMAAYGATKAAVNYLAESLRADLRSTAVEVQVVNPGFIRTRMTAPNTQPMPFLMDADTAARAYFEAMNDDALKRAFPFPLAAAVRLGQFLPGWLYYPLFGRSR